MTDDLDGLKSALRSEVCNECGQRSGDPGVPPPQAARCEDQCTLFANLPRLARITEEGEPPCGYEVFAKSLQPFLGTPERLNLVHALTIIEAAQADIKHGPGAR